MIKSRLIPYSFWAVPSVRLPFFKVQPSLSAMVHLRLSLEFMIKATGQDFVKGR